MISDILTWFIPIWLANSCSIFTDTLKLVSIEMAAGGGSEYGSFVGIAVHVQYYYGHCKLGLALV